MPRLVLVRYTTRCDHLFALGASGCELLLITSGTIDVLVFGYKRFGADWVLAEGTAETLVVPLLALVFHLFHASFEYLSAAIAPGGKRLIIAVGTEDAIVLRSERFVDQRHFAHGTEETVLMPVLVLIRQIL